MALCADDFNYFVESIGESFTVLVRSLCMRVDGRVMADFVFWGKLQPQISPIVLNLASWSGSREI